MLFLQLKQPDIEIPPDSVILHRITENTQNFLSLSWHDKLETVLNGAFELGLKLVAAAIVFFVGRWLIKRIDRMADRIFVRRNIDTSINTFVRNILRIAGWIILVMIVISILGIRTTSFVALLASAGFAIGMALSGTLQNFAGGVMILLLKPFRTGDYIAAQGYEGTVKEIKLMSTMIVTSDNRTIIMPNGGLSTSIINNTSANSTRRIEWIFGISYGDDYNTAKQVIRTLLDQEERIIEKPPYFIALKALDASSVNIVVRAWTNSSDYWNVFFDMNEKVYKIFPQHGLTIPFNQLEVTMADPDKGTAKGKKPTKPVPPPTEAAIMKNLKNIPDSDLNSEANSIGRDDLDLVDTSNPSPAES